MHEPWVDYRPPTMGRSQSSSFDRRCSVLTLTPDATEAIEHILEAPSVPEGAGIRIAPAVPTTDETVGSDLRVTVAEEPDDNDEVIEEGGARVFVEDTVTEYLADKQLDAQVVDERVGFTIAKQS
jgi:Fe-S cluster assembly iron-binding protein IscA